MEKLIQAIETRHPGFEVTELRIFASEPVVVEDYEDELVEAVRNAKEINVPVGKQVKSPH